MATTNTYRDFSFASTESYPVISNIEFLLEPQIVKELFHVNPLETDLGDFMKMGLMEAVEGEEVIHREKRKIIDAPFINADTTVANVYGTASLINGDPAAFVGLDYVQLAASAHTPTAGDIANTKSYPRRGMVIEFANKAFWRIQGKRDTVANAHRLYITKLDASYPSLAATLTVSGTTVGGDQITLPTINMEEASFGIDEGNIPVFQVIRSYLSTFTEFYKTTDKQLTNRTYPIQDPVSGKTINFWYEIGAYDTEKKFLLYEQMGCFAVPKADANAVAYDPISGTNKTLVTTAGYIPTLEANAPHKQYDDNVNLSLFHALARLRNRLNQEQSSMLLYGPEFGFRASDMITTLGINGSIVYDHNDVDLGIKTIRIPGADFNTKSLRILQNPQLTDLPGRIYPWYFIIKPMTQAQDAKTGIPLEAFTIMYKKQEGGGARGHYKVWMTGGMSPAANTRERARLIDYHSEKGVRTVGATKHILGVSAQF